MQFHHRHCTRRCERVYMDMVGKYSILGLEKSDFPVTVKYLGRDLSGNAATSPRPNSTRFGSAGFSTSTHFGRADVFLASHIRIKFKKNWKKVTNARPNLTRFCSWGVVQQSWSSMFHVFVHRTFSSSHTCEKRVLLVIYHRQFFGFSAKFRDF